MCGIIGVISNIKGDNIAPHILKGLSILEYRGYDSAGLVINDGHEAKCIKVVGKVKGLQEAVDRNGALGQYGIGHTRWATHGEPTVQNAHPIENSSLFLVHNGIIENYAEIKQMLQGKGYAFQGDTDTEVIAALIQDNMEKANMDELAAVRSAVNACHGSYAILVMSRANPQKIVGYRHGAPLLIGISPERLYFGSDSGMLAEFVPQVVDLEDGDLAMIGPDGYVIYNAVSAKPLQRQSRAVSKVDAASKGEYSHYMLKEIHEQESTILRCLNYSYDAHNRTILPDMAPIDWSGVKKIRFLACGTSRIAAEVAKHWFEKYAKIAVEVEVASEFRYRTPVILKDELFIFISQSGETADTLAALKYVRQLVPNNQTIGIVNVTGSTIARGVDHVIPIHAGLEIGVASTKAFTATLMTLILLTFKAASSNGLMSQEKVRAHINVLHNMMPQIQAALALDQKIKAYAWEMSAADKILYIGRAISQPMAIEGALKMKELSYIPSEGVAAGELKHGPIALVDDRTVIVAIAPDDELFLKTASNIQEVVARKGKVVLLSNAVRAKELAPACQEVFILPEADDFTMPLLYAIPLQLLAYYTALHRGNDVDQPRNLAKSVTVE